MPFFRRSAGPSDLVASEDVALFGRYSLLKEESGVTDPSAALALMGPLQERLYQGPEAERHAIDELVRHAEHGEWEAVGAWQFGRDFVMEDKLPQRVTDLGLLALSSMRITNLAIHLAPIDLPRFEELTHGPPPNDGFFGPPVFDSTFGPTRQYYFDLARTAAAARRPARLPQQKGVAPDGVEEASRAMWDFGMLVLRGPALVSPDVRSEPTTVRPAVEAATNVDHEQFCREVAAEIEESPYNGLWAYMGAARFLEEYLDPSLAGSELHITLIDHGLQELAGQGMIDLSFSSDVLSTHERARLPA